MISDITQFKRAQEKLVFLARASAVLGSSFDYRSTLAQVARQAIPVLADICIIDLADAKGGVVRRLEVACADPAKAERLTRYQVGVPRADDTTVLGRVMRTREPLLLSDCTPASLAATSGGFDHDILIKASGAQSMMVVPIVVRDTVLGAITLIAAESARRYTETSLSTARDLAAHAALAVDNARLYERAQQRNPRARGCALVRLPRSAQPADGHPAHDGDDAAGRSRRGTPEGLEAAGAHPPRRAADAPHDRRPAGHGQPRRGPAHRPGGRSTTRPAVRAMRRRCWRRSPSKRASRCDSTRRR